QNKQAFRGTHWTEPHFDRKFAAVFSTAEKIAPDSHGTAARLGMEVFTITDMPLAETFRNQRFDMAADQLAERITENGCGRRVGEADHASGVDHDHGVWRGIEHQPEFFFSALPLGDVNA